MAVSHIREAFTWLRSVGLVSDAEVLRQCARAYSRNSETREKLRKRMELHAALKEMAPSGLLRVTDDLGRHYQVEPTGRALASLTRRLKRFRPNATISVAKEQSPTLHLPFESAA